MYIQTHKCQHVCKFCMHLCHPSTNAYMYIGGSRHSRCNALATSLSYRGEVRTAANFRPKPIPASVCLCLSLSAVSLSVWSVGVAALSPAPVSGGSGSGVFQVVPSERLLSSEPTKLGASSVIVDISAIFRFPQLPSGVNIESGCAWRRCLACKQMTTQPAQDLAHLLPAPCPIACSIQTFEVDEFAS